MQIKLDGPLIVIAALFSVPTVADVPGFACKPFEYKSTGPTEKHCPPPSQNSPPPTYSGVSAQQCSQILHGNQTACQKKPPPAQSKCTAHAQSDYARCVQNAK
jgi:hypothetical protein